MICDTGGLISGLIAHQPHEEDSLAAINSADQLIVSPLVLCELDYLVTQRHGGKVAGRVLARLAEPEYEIATFESGDLLTALDVMETYADINIGLTDASLVVLAKRYNTNEILTLDQRHFRAIRGLDGRHFKLLPFDME
ncbi:MAG: PIN domain-containing protein [Actinomycetota bacterium]|nr:PIN domain-containing protein [Actinomycetota bacterium]